MIWAETSCVVTCAMSASRMRDSEALRFSADTPRLLIAASIWFCAAPNFARWVLTSWMAASIEVSSVFASPTVATLVLSVTNPDSGSATEEIEVEYDSDPLDIGFNSRYLLDIAAQIEGSVAYGLSAALYGECPVDKGRMTSLNFDTYEIMRIAEMPKVETVIVASGGFWGGVGEPTIAVAAPAVLNAIFAATGKRIRDLPLKNHSLKKA